LLDDVDPFKGRGEDVGEIVTLGLMCAGCNPQGGCVSPNISVSGRLPDYSARGGAL
jgi:hypothetical protein